MCRLLALTFVCANRHSGRRRGRPAKGIAETHQQKIERLQAELKSAQEALRVSEEKRASIVGHAALRYARHNTEFARQLASAMRVEVKINADRMMIGDVFMEDVASTTSAK
jgi:hypothetical protein